MRFDSDYWEKPFFAPPAPFVLVVVSLFRHSEQVDESMCRGTGSPHRCQWLRDLGPRIRSRANTQDIGRRDHAGLRSEIPIGRPAHSAAVAVAIDQRAPVVPAGLQRIPRLADKIESVRQ